ncbi:MAG: hypothetical protein HWE18_15390 [Gammaproteobacteria bacterium]|nr:hypothetical protein [Gammaproteobacteria bacterium]
MALLQLAAAAEKIESRSNLATILPSNIPMPICCDACDHEQTYTMTHLRQLPTLVCEDCGDSRPFSAFELNIIESTLKDMGYFLQKRA